MESAQSQRDFSLVIALPRLPPGQGGMERQAYLQAKSLCKRVDTTIICVGEDPALFALEPIRFICLRPYKGIAAKEVNALRVFCSMIYNGLFSKNNVLYIHQINLLTFLALLACRITDQLVFIKLANAGSKFDLRTFFSRYPPTRWFKTVFEHPAIHYLCLNDENKKDFCEVGLNVKNLYGFRNGVEISENHSNPILNGFIQYVGRLEPIKDVDFVLKLAAEMRQTQFRIIGTGSDQNKLWAKQKHIDNVRMLGELASNEIPWTDVEWVILPSRAEGMSNVLLEAIAHRKGIICRPIEANRFVGELTNKVVWINENVRSVAVEVSRLSGTEIEMSKSFERYEIDAVTRDLISLIQSGLHKREI